MNDTKTSTTNTNARPSGTRKVAMAALASLTLAVAVLMGSAQPASAWTYNGTTGKTGSITSVPPVRFVDLTIAGIQQGAFKANGPTVTRIAGTTAAQDVYITYVTERYQNNVWTQITSNTGKATIAAGRNSVTLPWLEVIPNAAKGIYRVSEYIYWAPAGATSSSRILGGAGIIPSAAGDMQCSTTSRPCASSGSYLQYGKLYSLGGGW